MQPARRRLLSRTLAGIAVAGTLFATVLIYAEQTLFDSESFSNHAVSVLDDEAVQTQLSNTITDAVIEQVPDAVAARPLIQSVTGLIVRSPALQSLLASSLRDVHATVIDGRSDTTLVTLENIGVLVSQALKAAAPDLSEEISRELEVDVIDEGDGGGPEIVIDLAQIGTDLEIGHWVALALALLAAGGSILLASTRLAGIRRLGRALAIGGIATVVLWQIGRAIVVGQFDGDAGDVAGGVYNAFLVDLRTWLLILAGSGIVITAGATSTREPVDAAGIAERSWKLITAVPRSSLLRGARAIALVIVGVLIIEYRDTAIDLAVILLAAFVIYVGATELMRLAAGAVRTDERTPSAARDAEQDLTRGGLARVLTVAALLLIGFVAVGVGTNSEETPPFVVETCNGSAELCDHRLDEVVFAATHNSMSAASYRDWFFAQHERGITEQLDAGIRALLIDPHYGVEVEGGRVATDLEADLGSRAKIEEGLGPESIAAAEQLRRQIGFDGEGETEVFLCHGFCEVGSIRWVEGLREVHDFLVANPGEVVIMSIEDATSPEDTVAGFEAAGLTDLVYKGADEPLPTLREMIDLDQRLFVMAERDGGEPPWYRRQFDITQETPYNFDSTEQLAEPDSCRTNRGPRDAPFFLMNNWVDTSPAPRPTNAKVVNTRRFLLDRVALCTEVRGIQPNVLAVDFYRRGDVVEAANELNGIAE